MGATRDSLLWRNPDPEELIHSQVVNKEPQATTELYLAPSYDLWSCRHPGYKVSTRKNIASKNMVVVVDDFF